MANEANLKDFVKGYDSRRYVKQPGARERQITRARKLLERAASMNDVQKAIFDIDTAGLTELDAIYLIQMEKAKLGDKDAFKACMDYSGYKPSEHVEFNDNTNQLSEEEEREENRLWLIDMERKAIERSEQVNNEANSIVNKI